MKKTTVYLEDNEFKALKNQAFVEEVPVAELIRRGVKLVCEQSSPETQKAMKALNRIRQQVADSGVNEDELNQDILEAKKSVRKQMKP